MTGYDNDYHCSLFTYELVDNGWVATSYLYIFFPIIFILSDFLLLLLLLLLLISIEDSSLRVIISSQGIFEIGIGMTSITNISKIITVEIIKILSQQELEVPLSCITYFYSC